jgi:hypothetical protein
MITLKDGLFLLAIFVAYGLVGRLDYEDAIRLDQIRQERARAECPPEAMPTQHETEAPRNAALRDPPGPADAGPTNDSVRCAPPAF